MLQTSDFFKSTFEFKFQKMKNHLSTFLLLTLLPLSTLAQDTITMSKQFLLEEVKKENKQIKIAEQGYQAAKAGYRQANTIHLPNINFSYTAISTNLPLTAFGSKINQEAVTMADFNPDVINNPGNVQNFNTRIELQQPIFNFDAPYQRNAAKAQADALQLKWQRTAEYIEMETGNAYMQLQMAYAVADVLYDAKKTVLANQKLVNDYYDNGLMQKSDVLNMQVRVLDIENQIKYAQSNIANASEYIHHLLHKTSPSAIIKPADTLSVNMEIRQSIAINENRKDIAAMSKALEAHQYMAMATQKKFLPRLNAFASYELNDKRLTRFKGEGYMAGLQLTWNIFSGQRTKYSIQQANINRQQAKEELDDYKSKTTLELNKTRRQLTDASNKIALTQQTLHQSREAYRIRYNRYTQGLEKSSDLLNAEMQVTKIQLELKQAILEYNITAAYLKFLTQ